MSSELQIVVNDELIDEIEEIAREAAPEGIERYKGTFIFNKRMMWKAGHAVLRHYPELREYEPKSGNPQLAEGGGGSANYSTVAEATGYERRRIKKWVETAKDGGDDEESFTAWVEPLAEDKARRILGKLTQSRRGSLIEGVLPEDNALSLHGDKLNTIYIKSCDEGMVEIPDNSVHCVITSPPYWKQRDYQTSRQIGAEDTAQEYVDAISGVSDSVRRVLRDDGTFWLNIGDKYDNGNLIGLPWMVAQTLKDDGWILRNEIIWHKPAPMPQGDIDRCTQAHEHIFFFVKSREYFYDAAAVATPTKNGDGKPRVFRNADPNQSLRGDDGRGYQPRETANLRDVWTVGMEPSKVKHLAVYPSKLIEPCILAGCPVDGIVLDPFMGSGTTGVVAIQNARHYLGYENNPEFAKVATERIRNTDRGLGL